MGSKPYSLLPNNNFHFRVLMSTCLQICLAQWMVAAVVVNPNVMSYTSWLVSLTDQYITAMTAFYFYNPWLKN